MAIVHAVLECVVNISEGRQREVIDAIAASTGDDLLDVHTDPHHNRTVITVVGEAAPRQLACAALEHLDISAHQGVHPRIGVIDVVPFVPLAGSTMDDAVRARDDFARWVAADLGIPSFVYGSERSLPDIRRHAFDGLEPTYGPAAPHPRGGAVAVGARQPLVAWNLYLRDADLEDAKRIAAAIRGPQLRSLGLLVGDQVQVSMNLIAPKELGPGHAWDLVAQYAHIERAELVGLVPQAVLDRTPVARWDQLDLSAQRTIEGRLRRTGAGVDGPSFKRRR